MINKFDAINEALNIAIPNIEELCKDSYISLNDFIQVISRSKYNLYKDLGVSSTTSNRFLNKILPKRPMGCKPCTYILSLVGMKGCSGCNLVRFTESFHKNKSRLDGLNSQCKECAVDKRAEYFREAAKKRKYLKLDRIPKWANLSKIKEMYKGCPAGYHVDHIVPLQGKLVSGLHVENNLQYLTAEDNLEKSNKFEV